MRFYPVILFAVLSSGCATIFKGTSQSITVSSDPKDVRVYVDGASLGSAENSFIIKKGFDTKNVVLKKDGYQDAAIFVKQSFDPISILNIFFWPGFIIDAASGAMMKIEQVQYSVKLEKKK